MDTRIGILAGTGLEGTGLALRFAKVGFQVAIGSRCREKAKRRADELAEKLGSNHLVGAGNDEVAASSDLIFLAAPFEHATGIIESCKSYFRQGCILVDVTVPLVFQNGRVSLLPLQEGSGSQHLARRVPPEVPLVATFKTISAKVLADLSCELDCDEFVCSDWPQAKARVMGAMRSIRSLRPLDAGPLREARALEHMTALAIGMNRRLKAREVRFRVVGL